MARAATAAENAVPLTIPSGSFDAKVIGSMPCTLNASGEGTFLRTPAILGPSKHWIDWFPTVRKISTTDGIAEDYFYRLLLQCTTRA
jgi:hypothetical protein